MGKTKKRTYTQEFKQQAAELARNIGVCRAAKQLGVPMSSVNGWTKKSKGVEEKSTEPKVNLQEENRRLRKEVEELKKVNHILKRAAAFFSQDHLK